MLGKGGKYTDKNVHLTCSCSCKTTLIGFIIMRIIIMGSVPAKREQRGQNYTEVGKLTHVKA